MLIGIDASCWWNRRGFGRFTRELLQALFALPGPHRYCLFIDQPPEPEMHRDNVRIVKVKQGRPVTRAATADSRRSVGDMLAFTRAVARVRPDLMYFPAVYSWFPTPPAIPAVITFHDAIAEHYPKLIFPHLKGRLLWSLKLRLARWQAARFITVSRAARDEIIAYLNISSEKIDIISEAPGACFVPQSDQVQSSKLRRRIGLPERARLIVYVGGFAPHKNLRRFLQGFAEAQDAPFMADVHVAMVGDTDGAGFYSHYDELASDIRADPRLQGRVHFCGFVEDQALAILYADAIATIMPALSEGFGLPAVESIACGTPVLATGQGAVEEVIGDAGLYFDPYSKDQIADRIRTVAGQVETLRELRIKALKRANRFTWPKAAAQLMDSLNKTMGIP